MIDPVTGAALAEALTGITVGMAGQSLSDAYDERMTGTIGVEVGPPIGYGDWTSDRPSISGDTNGTISDGTGETPVDAWNDYIENTPSAYVSDTTGGAVSGSNVYTLAYSLMEENPGTAMAVVKAVAPVAVPIGTAVVAISQALGVSMNYSEVSDTIKSSLASAVEAVGGLYDEARGLVTAWKDELGRILFPKKTFDAVNDELLELGIPVGGETEESRTSDINTGNIFPQPISTGPVVLTGGNPVPMTNCVASSLPGAIRAYVVAYSASYGTHATFHNQNLNCNNSYTHNGLTAYYANFATPVYTGGTVLSCANTCLDTVSTLTAGGGIAWTMLYGAVSGGGEYPEGTSRSEASSYTPMTIPIAGDLATSYDPDTAELLTEPLVSIHIPDDPTDTTGDTTDPIDPTDDDNTGVVNPPVPLPIPDTKPSNPNVPLVNPSIVDSTLVEELVEELANTLDPQAPQSSGIIPVPELPGIGDPPTFPSIIPTSGPGFIHVYNPTPAEFVAFGTWLWVTYADATIDKILNNPFDGVIGAHELYATPNTDGSDNIRSAFLTCPTTAALVPNRYSEIDCGTVVIPEFYGNYLDYSPYSQAYIYLPFIGINEVSIDDIVGHAVNIRYRVDSYSGSCIAMIFVAKDDYQNLCYQFAGSCSVEVPMAGGSQAAIKAGEMQAEAYSRAGIANAALNGAAAIGSGLASGGLAGGLLGGLSALGGIAGAWYSGQRSIDAARVANKSTVQHSGQFGASHGAMSKKEPFIIIRNPIQVKVTNYNEDYGFPAHKRVIVGGCRGYLRVREVNVVSAHATDEEKMAIESALKNGVYVS